MADPYAKQTWIDNNVSYPVSAARMGVIEDGINTAHTYYNVKAQYGGAGAVGDGSNDDTAAIQRAEDALYNAGGGILFFPKATYKISGTINRHIGSCWMGAADNNSTMGQLTQIWCPSAVSVMVQVLAGTNKNITGTWTKNLCFMGGVYSVDHWVPTAGIGIQFLKDSTGEGKLDSWTWFDNCQCSNLTGNGISIETDGCTNFSISRSRWDVCQGYGVYIKCVSSAFATIRECTYDTGGLYNCNGAFYFDATAASDGGKFYLGLHDLNLEVNYALAQTYTATGTDSVDQRGIIRLGVKYPLPSQKNQFDILCDHLRVPIGPGTVAQDFSWFQCTSSAATIDTTVHEQAVRLNITEAHGVNTWSNGGSRQMRVLGGVSSGYRWPYEGLSVTNKQITEFCVQRQDTVGTEVARRVNIGHFLADKIEIGLSPSAAPSIVTHTATPESVITANPGSICLVTSGDVYIKASGTGNTGWKLVTRAA